MFNVRVTVVSNAAVISPRYLHLAAYMYRPTQYVFSRGVAFSYFHLHWRRALLSPPFNISGHAVELRNWTKCRLCCCNCYGKEHWNISLYRPWLDSDKRSTVRLISPQPFNLLGSIDVGRLKEKQLSHIRSSTSGLCWRSVGLWMWRLRSYHWSI